MTHISLRFIHFHFNGKTIKLNHFTAYVTMLCANTFSLDISHKIANSINGAIVREKLSPKSN